jgi:hypothetical protein
LVIHKSRKHHLTIGNQPLLDEEKVQCSNCTKEFGTSTELQVLFSFLTWSYHSFVRLQWHQYNCLKKELIRARRSASRASSGSASAKTSPTLVAPFADRLTASASEGTLTVLQKMVSPRQKMGKWNLIF